MKYTATVMANIGGRTKNSLCKIDSGITVAQAKQKCYESLDLPKLVEWEKVKEEIWLDTPITKENPVKKPANDNLVMDSPAFQSFDYYLTLKPKTVE